MTDLARKLQTKDRGIEVLNAPKGVVLDLPPGSDAGVLLFVRDRAELDDRAEPALAAARADRLAWIAYPKAGKLGTDLNRDTLWAALEGRGVRPVRQVAIDDTWSAMRFRPAD
jgi:hypothetical protein